MPCCAIESQPDDVDLLYDQALLAERLGNFEAMERQLRKVIASKPDYMHAYNALGYSFADRNVRLPEARELIEKALKQSPEDPMILDSMGWVEFRMGKLNEALLLLQRAYQIRRDAEIAAHLGEVFWLPRCEKTGPPGRVDGHDPGLAAVRLCLSSP